MILPRRHKGPVARPALRLVDPDLSGDEHSVVGPAPRLPAVFHVSISGPAFPPLTKLGFRASRTAVGATAVAAVAIAFLACGQAETSTDISAKDIARMASTPTSARPVATATSPSASPTAAPESKSAPTAAPEPTPSPRVVAEPTPSPRVAAEPTPSPEGAAEPASSSVARYDSTINMYRLFSGEGHPAELTMLGLQEARANKDTSLVGPIIEFMRFLWTIELFDEAILTLAGLTGESFGPDWSRWMEWFGRNADAHVPPDGYVDWKIGFMSLIHPRFADFLEPAKETAHVNVVEIVWGGVAPDGIPDIRDPVILTPEEADYLLPYDRVFGVSINGEHRAYPFRIVNAHEMANDVLGGEPIALAY